ncbi:hypothetical protein [Dehalogenimonas etheniformans]|nr:hypothetical protein [Dehalogenimonas etheniformans]QNT75900.1 hypothetical protein HX448_03960 [Dehalogenimonas etheniformans]
MKDSYHLPYSGQIIGEVFKALRAPYPRFIKKEAQRLFRGERIDDAPRKDILFTLAEAMVDSNLIPYPEIFKEAFVCRWGTKNMLVQGISEYAGRWDALCSKLRYWVIPKSKKDAVLLGCFRLATVDLALRLASFRHLSKLPPLEQVIPLWAKRGGNILFLKRLKERCIEWPSNDELFKDVGAANEKTKVNWFYHGRRPSQEYIIGLAAAFSKRIPGASVEDIAIEINRHYALSALCERIAFQIGWDRVLELVGALYHQTARIQRLFAEDPKPIEEYYTRHVIHLFSGAQQSCRAPWLKRLWETEKDREWKKDYIFVERDWASRLIQVNFRFVGESVLDRSDWGSVFNSAPDEVTPVATHFSALAVDQTIDDEFLYWEKSEFNEIPVERRLERKLRKQIEAHPESAKAHLHLGVVLGDNPWASDRISEGFKECLKAIQLRPTWDLPRIEAAIMFLNCKQYNEALAIVEEAAAVLSKMTSRLAYATAFCLMAKKEFLAALEKFELAIALKPDLALALDNAAFCAFHSGLAGKGRTLARRARQHGISDTYDLYDVGGWKRRFQQRGIEPLCRTIPCPEKNCAFRD